MKYLILLLFLASCSPQKQLQRLAKHHPELFTKSDSIEKDTITTKESVKDTSFALSNCVDTVVIHDHNLTVKYVHRNDSIFIQGKCDPDTLIVEKKVVKYAPIQKEKFIPQMYLFTFWGFIILVILFLLFIFLLAWRKFR